MASNPAIASRLQSTRPVGRVAELGSLGGEAQQIMKLRINPYKLFFWLVLTAILAAEIFEHRIEGQKWTQGYEPYAQFLISLMLICIGPSLIAAALNARASENSGTIWKKTWPATFLVGVLMLVGGAAKLWKLFAG